MLPTVMGPLIWEVAAPKLSEPLLTLTVVAEFVERLRAASLEPVETVPVPVRSMVAVSVAVGTPTGSQSPGVSHCPPVGATEVFQL